VLRHTFASWLLAAGRPITEVARLLGHGSPTVTLSTYAHWVRQDEGAAAAALERFAAGAADAGS
jgi:integrase